MNKVPKNNNDSYSNEIMEALAEMLGVSKFENKHVVKKLYTFNEMFDAVMEYEGFIGYGDKIRRYVREIYGIDLDNVRE